MAQTWDYDLKPVTVVLGAFGSGKTEVALNCAVGAARLGRSVTLVDLDTATPAFRSRQAESALAEAGVVLVAPQGALAHADLPAVPAEVRAVLGDPSRTVIVDAGGHPAGVRPVSSLRDLTGRREAAAWVVVNPWRPETDNPRSISFMIERLAARARIPVSGVVANLHFPGEATPESLSHGLAAVGGGAGLAGLELSFCSVRRELAGTVGRWLPRGMKVLWLELYMRAPWDVEAGPVIAGVSAPEQVVRERVVRGG